MRNSQFDPPYIEVAVGTRVTATNYDSVRHTWTGRNNTWESGDMAQNQSYTHTFSAAGTFPYTCRYHPTMTGTVNVR